MTPADRGIDRYSRQALLSFVGPDGQTRLSSASVLVVGCGATGGSAAAILARAGIGSLILVDRDWVEWSNLQRQPLFTEQDATDSLPKAEAAARRLQAENSEISIQAVVAHAGPASLPELARSADLIVDGTDNWETRYLINDLSVRDAIPWVYAGALEASGMAMAIRPGSGPCLRCLQPEPPPAGHGRTCDIAGVWGPAVAVAGALAAAEAMRLLLDRAPPETKTARLVSFDLWSTHWQVTEIRRKDACPCCGRGEFPFLQEDRQAAATLLCGRSAIQVTPAQPFEIDLPALARKLPPGSVQSLNPYLLRASISGESVTFFRDGRAILDGVSDEGRARSLYARWIEL